MTNNVIWIHRPSKYNKKIHIYWFSCAKISTSCLISVFSYWIISRHENEKERKGKEINGNERKKREETERKKERKKNRPKYCIIFTNCSMHVLMFSFVYYNVVYSLLISFVELLFECMQVGIGACIIRSALA